MSPGPGFVLVARTSNAVSRLDGLSMATGMGNSGVIFAVLVLAGLQTVFHHFPWFYFALKVFGGLYLVFLALKIWTNANTPMVQGVNSKELSGSLLRSFLIALVTQLSNPKAVIIYGSIFAALLPPEMSLAAMVLLLFLIFLVETGWYTIVVLVLSSKYSAPLYLNSRVWIDRVVAIIMGALGLKLLSDAVSTFDD